MKTPERIETIASLTILALVLIGCLLVLRPFISAILWAGVLCFCTWPVFARLKGVFGAKRRTSAALTMTVAIGLVLILPFVLVGATLASNVEHMQEWFRNLHNALPAEAPAQLTRLPVVGPYIERSWGNLLEDTARTSKTMQTAAVASGKWALRHSLDLGMGIAQLLLSMLVVFAFYRDGEWLVARIEAGARRILGDSAQRQILIVGNTIRSVVYGILGTGMAQAIMAAVGFWIAGIPSPFLLGMITFVFSFVPIGPPLIWIPAAIWLFTEDRTGWAIFMVIYGAIAISGIDNVVKPLLIKSGTNLPFVTILMGVIGGVLAFGFIGLFLGPVLLAVGYNLVREFTTDHGRVKAG